MRLSQPPQRVAELDDPGSHPSFYSAERKADLFGDFHLCQVREICEFEEFAFARLQFADRRLDDPGALGGFEFSQRIGRLAQDPAADFPVDGARVPP